MENVLASSTNQLTLPTK